MGFHLDQLFLNIKSNRHPCSFIMETVFTPLHLKKIAAAACDNPHLEDLFLDYLRLCATEKEMRSIHLSYQTRLSLTLITRCALDAFLVETSRSLPIESLNGQMDDFLDEMKQRVYKKYHLNRYF